MAERTHEANLVYTERQFREYLEALNKKKKWWALIVLKGNWQGYNVVIDPGVKDPIRIRVDEGPWRVRDIVEQTLATSKKFSPELETAIDSTLHNDEKCLWMRVDEGLITDFSVDNHMWP